MNSKKFSIGKKYRKNSILIFKEKIEQLNSVGKDIAITLNSITQNQKFLIGQQKKMTFYMKNMPKQEQSGLKQLTYCQESIYFFIKILKLREKPILWFTKKTNQKNQQSTEDKEDKNYLPYQVFICS